MEYWTLEYWDIIRELHTFSQYSNTPVLQYSEIKKYKDPRWNNFFLVIEPKNI